VYEQMSECPAHLAGIFGPDAATTLGMPRLEMNSGRDCIVPTIAAAKPTQMAIARFGCPVDGDQAAKALSFEF
jgi:hypothetical protein